MPYEIAWYAENLILQVSYTGDLTLKEVISANFRVGQILESSPHKIHLLLNLEQLETVNFQLNEMVQHPMVAATARHRNVGWVVRFNRNNPFYNFISTVIRQTHQQTAEFFDTQAEALDFLKSLDPRLEHLP